MKTLIINRNKWTRGGINKFDNPTTLLNNHGCMCCLGFHALQFTKATKECIDGVSTPESITYKCNIGKTILLTKRTPFEKRHHTEFSKKAIVINDDRHISEKDRESRLKKLFKTKGYAIKFTGKSQ